MLLKIPTRSTLSLCSSGLNATGLHIQTNMCRVFSQLISRGLNVPRAQVLDKGLEGTEGSASANGLWNIRFSRQNLFRSGFLFYQHWCKAWSHPWERTEMVGGDWTTSRLLSPSISLHVAVSFVCQSKGRWMRVNWNQFPLSDTINGVARRRRGGGLWLLILPRKHARNLPPGIRPATITTTPHTHTHTRNPPPILYTHGYILKYPLVPFTHPQGRMGDRGVAGGCPQSSHPQRSRDREEEKRCTLMYWKCIYIWEFFFFY